MTSCLHIKAFLKYGLFVIKYGKACFQEHRNPKYLYLFICQSVFRSVRPYTQMST